MFVLVITSSRKCTLRWENRAIGLTMLKLSGDCDVSSIDWLIPRKQYAILTSNPEDIGDLESETYCRLATASIYGTRSPLLFFLNSHFRYASNALASSQIDTAAAEISKFAAVSGLWRWAIQNRRLPSQVQVAVGSGLRLCRSLVWA